MSDAKARPIVWVGGSRKQVRNFPLEVKKAVADALFDVQMGSKPPDAKPLKGVGSGVFEIVTRHDSNTYRTVYAVQIGSSVYVLYAFQKKSKKGIKTQKNDVDLIKRRYQQALEMEKLK